MTIKGFIIRQQFTAEVLTCCDNKEQQAGVELHFQSWDISVSETLLIPNPYSSDVQYLCVMMTSEPRRAKKFISSFPASRAVPAKRRGVRNFPSPSFPSNGNRRAVRGTAQHGHLNELHVCRTVLLVMWDGQRFFVRPRACSVRQFVWFKRTFPKMRGRNPVVAAGSWFLRTCLNATQETFTTGGMETWHDRAGAVY